MGRKYEGGLMVALPVSLNGKETITETGFVRINFKDGNGKAVEFAATPSVTVTPEAQEIDVEKQRYSFEKVEVGKGVADKLSALSKVKMELPRIKGNKGRQDFLAGKQGTAISRVAQLDVKALGRLLPKIDLPKIDISSVTSKVSVQALSKISIGKGMTIKSRTTDREKIKKAAQDRLGDWTFSKTFSISRWDKTLSFNLNTYRNKVATAVSWAGVTVVGIADGKLTGMFDDEFKDYMRDNVADTVNPKIQALTGAVEDSANAVINMVNKKVIAKFNTSITSLGKEVDSIFNDMNDAISSLIGIDKNKDMVPDTGVNAMMTSLAGQINKAMQDRLNAVMGEINAIKDAFSGAFGGLEEGINAIVGNVEDTVNKKFEIVGEAVQEAIDEINAQVNKALTASGVNLYANMNLPTNLSIAPAPVRSITTTGFQVYSNGTPEKPMVLNWVAVGMASGGTVSRPRDGDETEPVRGGVFGDILGKFT